jgi:hypothetical protein
MTTWDFAQWWARKNCKLVRKTQVMSANEVIKTLSVASEQCRGIDNRHWLFIYTDSLFECGGDIFRFATAAAKCVIVSASGGMLFSVKRDGNDTTVTIWAVAKARDATENSQQDAT